MVERGKGPTADRGAEQTVRWSRQPNHAFNRYVITPLFQDGEPECNAPTILSKFTLTV